MGRACHGIGAVMKRKNNWREVAESMWAIQLLGAGEHVKKIDAKFLQAFRVLSQRNDPEPLVEYLWSDQPLGLPERDMLARVIWRMAQPGKKKTGRPRSGKRELARFALHFYKSLRERNKRLGIKDRGQCDDMKDFSVRAVVEFSHEGRGIPANIDEAFIEAVRTEMDRPRSRL
jgi:hypothetical protein